MRKFLNELFYFDNGWVAYDILVLYGGLTSLVYVGLSVSIL